MADNNLAAIYCRLSREDGNEGESESIQNQKMLLTEYCRKMEWRIYKIYCDDDYSGLDINRPAFNELIQDAKERRFDIVLCKNQSRFSRDMEVVEKYIHGLFGIWNIRFVGLVDNADTMNRTGKKARQINGLINEWYCEDISENVRAALNIKKRNGQYLGHWCPYGYRLSRKDSHKMEIDPFAAQIVERIFYLFTGGKSIREIASILDSEGVKIPSVYKRSIGINYHNPSCRSDENNGWSVNTIRKILKDRTYTGALIQGRERKISYKCKKVIRNRPEEWIEAENCHEAIISGEVFEKASQMLKTRRRKQEDKNGEMILRGKVFCAGCREAMHINRKADRVYLRCPNGVKKKCSFHTIRYELLEEAVEGEIKNILGVLLSQEDLSKIYEMIKSENSAENRNMKDIERRKEIIDNALCRLYVDKTEGIIDTENFINIRKKLLTEKESLNNLSETLYSKELDLSMENIFKFDFDTVNSLIERIEIGEKINGERKISIYWNF